MVLVHEPDARHGGYVNFGDVIADTPERIRAQGDCLQLQWPRQAKLTSQAMHGVFLRSEYAYPAYLHSTHCGRIHAICLGSCSLPSMKPVLES